MQRPKGEGFTGSQTPLYRDPWTTSICIMHASPLNSNIFILTIFFSTPTRPSSPHQLAMQTRSRSSASAASLLLMDLADDTLVKTFCHLSPGDIAHVQRISTRCNILGKGDEVWAAHVTTLSREYATDESQWRVDELTDADASAPSCDAHLIPADLIPFTTSDAKRKERAEHDAWWERRLSGKTAEYRKRQSVPRWRTLESVTQYRCYAANEAELSPLARTDVWVAHPFPESTCCCMQLTTPDEFHAHMKSWRHYTFCANVQHPEDVADYDVDAVYIDIDPRMVDGQAAFDALPKHVAFKRLKRYVDHINDALESRRDADTWSEYDHKNMERIVKAANDCFADRSGGEFNDTDSGEHEIVYSLKDMAEIVVGHALDTFKSGGPFVEIYGVPYLTVDELAAVGLMALDPFGGSSSSRTFMETLSQFDFDLAATGPGIASSAAP